MVELKKVFRILLMGLVFVFSVCMEKPSFGLIKTANLKAAWRFEGNANDWSGGGYNLTVNGSASLTTGKFGQAYTFNGTTDNLTYSPVATAFNVASGGSASISLWVKTSSNDAGLFYIQGGVGGIPLIYMQIGDSTAGGTANKFNTYTRADNGSAKIPLNGSATVNDNAWHHLVVVLSDTTVTSYVDGAQDATSSLSGANNGLTFTAGSNSIYIGSIGGGHYLNGIIDEVRFYKRALTAVEVRALMLNYDPGEF